MVDIRADVYALGGTLYFMLTGQTPYPDGTIAAKLVAHQIKEPRPVESFRSDVPAGMLAVLRKMMSKDPNYRYQEPIEVADALSQWADLPITPPPVREMPVHCPLVQALAGPSAPNSGAPLARVLFGSGRAFNRGSGGSSVHPASGATVGGGTSPSTVSFGRGAGSNPSIPRGNGSVPVGGPVSTGRASASPTTPLPPRHDSGEATPLPGSGPHVALPTQNRMSLYIIAILLALLFLVGAIA